MHALLEMQARLEGVGTGVKALIATKDDCIRGLVADRIEAPPELTPALAGLLGSRLQDVVVRDVEHAVTLLEEMARSKKGRATITPMRPRYVAGAHASVPTGEGVVCRLIDELRYAAEDESLVHALVGDAVVVTDLDAARRVRENVYHAPFYAPVVTLSGTVLFPDGRVAGGTGEDVAAGMLDSKRETRELGNEVERLELLVSERLAAHQALRGAIAETQGALDRARHQAHADELATVTAEKDLRAAHTQLETSRRRLEVLAAESEDLAHHLHEASGERDEAQRILDEAQTLLDDVTSKVADGEVLAASWQEQVSELRHIVTEKKMRLAGAREKLNAARGTLLRLDRSTSELVERRSRLEVELVAGARAFGETAAVLVAHKTKLQDALDISRAAAEVLEKARAEYEAIRAP
jgi:chromosome segregation protein